jgi:thiol-disulfide isomerase/thioredoxin
LGQSDFNGQTIKRGGTLAVVFLASWCSFCRRFLPAFRAAAESNNLLWASADLSEYANPLWSVFDIEVVPTVIVFKEGRLMFRIDGVLGRGLSQKAIEDIVSRMKLLSE